MGRTELNLNIRIELRPVAPTPCVAANRSLLRPGDGGGGQQNYNI